MSGTSSRGESSKRRRKSIELDKMGVWNPEGVLSEIREAPSVKRGTLIPRLSADHVGVCVSQGRRPYQEDRHVVTEQVGRDLSMDILVLAVFDGHGGHTCAEFCKQNVTRYITRHISLQLPDKWGKSEDQTTIVSDPEVDLSAALSGAILELNDSFRRSCEAKGLEQSASGKQQRTSGTTATIAVLRDGYELVVAQLGDSRALLLRGGGEKEKSRCLTADHCASDPGERARIEAAGGTVSYDEIGRHLVNKRLAMSRSIGDLDLKSYGVTAEPSLVRSNIKHYKDSALVMVTDGITFVMSNEEIADCVMLGDSPKEAAEKVVDQALLHSCQDNLTALVLPLGAWGRHRTDVASGTTVMMSLGRSMTHSSRFG